MKTVYILYRDWNDGYDSSSSEVAGVYEDELDALYALDGLKADLIAQRNEHNNYCARPSCRLGKRWHPDGEWYQSLKKDARKSWDATHRCRTYVPPEPFTELDPANDLRIESVLMNTPLW